MLLCQDSVEFGVYNDDVLLCCDVPPPHDVLLFPNMRLCFRP